MAICLVTDLNNGEECGRSLFDCCRDYMEATMERTTQVLNYLQPLLKKANPELYDYLEGWATLVFFFHYFCSFM